jgi:hypothetical protein
MSKPKTVVGRHADGGQKRIVQQTIGTSANNTPSNLSHYFFEASIALIHLRVSSKQ